MFTHPLRDDHRSGRHQGPVFTHPLSGRITDEEDSDKLHGGIGPSQNQEEGWHTIQDLGLSKVPAKHNVTLATQTRSRQ